MAVGRGRYTGRAGPWLSAGGGILGGQGHGCQQGAVFWEDWAMAVGGGAGCWEDWALAVGRGGRLGGLGHGCRQGAVYWEDWALAVGRGRYTGRTGPWLSAVYWEDGRVRYAETTVRW
ncbi:hypothetical protein chiPu_0034012 [Chiloscyllium punctatum]|uniref:Uncharacterized protein n=1 Tax=Chiloscyllium punctatum TaxID=137246 RepID=A0A401U3Z0_CHIPU|nr:hypothetical protein [Chiloscyllium punctatum]